MLIRKYKNRFPNGGYSSRLIAIGQLFLVIGIMLDRFIQGSLLAVGFTMVFFGVSIVFNTYGLVYFKQEREERENVENTRNIGQNDE